MAKKYISADLRVINLGANDIIATSTPGYGTQSVNAGSALSGGRRDLFDDSYDEF